MAPVTVRYNGVNTVEEIVETPAAGTTAGEYLSALLDAHACNVVDGDVVELVMPDGEPVPDDLDVELLSGLTVTLKVLTGEPSELKGDERFVAEHAGDDTPTIDGGPRGQVDVTTGDPTPAPLKATGATKKRK